MTGKAESSKKTKSLSPLVQESPQRFKNRAIVNKDIFKVSDEQDGGTRTVKPVYTKGISPEDAEKEFRERVCATTGTSCYDAGLGLLTSACEAVTKSSTSLSESISHLNAIAKTMQAFEPRDEIEGQLLSQLAVLYQHSMGWLGRAMRTERVDFANTYLNGASKLLARHHETIATLMKYRRGGEQHVYVEHVHVNDGGKAIVGNVGTGGGLNQKNEEGPHAKV